MAVMFTPEGSLGPSYQRGLVILGSILSLIKASETASSATPSLHPTLGLIISKLDKFKRVLTQEGKEKPCSFGRVVTAGMPATPGQVGPKLEDMLLTRPDLILG